MAADEERRSDDTVGETEPSDLQSHDLEGIPSPESNSQDDEDEEDAVAAAAAADDDDDDNDDDDEKASTQSLTESVFEVHQENGRTYHGYRAGTYPFPCDQAEQDRLDFQHCTIHEAMSQQLHFAPLENPKHILDVGTGTGIWAIEMGDKYPEAYIEATDLSLIQPKSIPPNVHFFIDDASQEDWATSIEYDFIHTRILLGAFEDFRHIIAKSFEHLRPGGWMESQEVFTTPFCDDGSMPDDWPILTWNNDLDEAAEENERPLRIADKLRRWYEEAGFVDVQEVAIKLPINSWPDDKHAKNLGLCWGENLLLGVQGLSLAYLSRVRGWNKLEIEIYLIGIRKALLERPPTVHAYQKLFVVWGRKPPPPPLLLLHDD